MLNALTIDIEEHFQVHAFEMVIDRREWESFPSRVTPSTRHALRLLDAYGIRATFFVLGWVADRHPELMREIAAAGHEIASHGYWHELIYRQTPDEFAADLDRSLNAIKRALDGQKPSARDRHLIGYRAPSFSITRQSLWALDILVERGIRYDSSIFPLVAHDRYGFHSANRFATRLRDNLWEFPVSTIRLVRQNWPVAGGGYLRLLPFWVTQQAIRRINAEGHPSVVYVHTWELDPEQPRISDAPLLSRFRHYVNLHKTERRFKRLLETFAFAPMRDVYAGCLEGL